MSRGSPATLDLLLHRASPLQFAEPAPMNAQLQLILSAAVTDGCVLGGSSCLKARVTNCWAI